MSSSQVYEEVNSFPLGILTLRGVCVACMFVIGASVVKKLHVAPLSRIALLFVLVLFFRLGINGLGCIFRLNSAGI